MVQINQGPDAGSYASVKVVDCPRCHEQCWWCSDYRHMHGALTLPGTRRRCTVPLTPEGNDCPVCHGTRKATVTTTYAPSPNPQDER